MKRYLLICCLLALCVLSKSTAAQEVDFTRLNPSDTLLKVYTIANGEDSLLLRRPSSNFTREEIASESFGVLANLMIKTVTHPSQDGVGIAGPQVGVLKRVVAVQRFDKEGYPFEVYPNIRITALRGELAPGPEGCLSVPDMRGDVLRYRDIDIEYTSPTTLEVVKENIKGFTAVIFQHEADHLDGILYIDRLPQPACTQLVQPSCTQPAGTQPTAAAQAACTQPATAAQPSCTQPAQLGATAWYIGSTTGKEADMLYYISTEVAASRDSLGNISLQALITPQEKMYMDEEIAFVERTIAGNDFNFYAPYYHQYTFEAIGLKMSGDSARFAQVEENVKREAIEAFRYYMKNYNGGRDFILAGFSQGAELAIEIIKSMSAEEYEKMAAAYIIGFQLTQEDLSHPNIKAAEDETSRGVCISFNSVLSREGIWPQVSGRAHTCINPLNWSTGSKSAKLEFKGMKGKVSVDKRNNVLLVKINKAPFHKWMEEHPLFGKMGAHPDCLHHWDILFYNESLKKNAVKRAYGR